MTSTGAARLHYLDAMRSVLMLLGVVLHSARPYDTGPWRVKDVQQLPLLDGMVAFLHLFRMPAFFVIAGFFAMYLIRRRPTGVFLRERMRRTVIPLIVVLLTVNVLQAWFVARYVHHDAAPLVTGVLLPQLWSGSLVSHLWFLGCLVVYFALVALAAPALRRLAEWELSTSSRGQTLALAGVTAAAVVAPVVVAAFGSIFAPWPQMYILGVIRPLTVLQFLPFFAVGLMLCAFPALLERFSRVTWTALALAGLGGAGLYFAELLGGTIGKALAMMAEALLAWMAIRAVFTLFRRFADHPSGTFRYLSDASYSIYLFHHVIVIMVATWLLPVEMAPGLKFIVVLAIVSVASVSIYHVLIRRSALLSYLFNGAVRPAAAGDVISAPGDTASATAARRASARA